MNAHQKIIKDNVRSILKIITNHYGVKYSAALYQILKEHPDFPSFLSFQYILHRMGKDSFAIHTSYEELTNMPAPFIVHGVTNVDLFLFITKATAESVQIIDEKGKEESIKKEDFEKMWDGNILIIDNLPGKINIPSKSKLDLFIKLAKYPFLILCLVALCTYSLILKGVGDILFYVYLLVLLGGLGTSILLFIEQIDKYNVHIKRLCSSNGSKSNIDCSSILDFKDAYFMGLASWSDIGFVYFTSLLTILLVLPFGTSQAFINILSLFSIGYVCYSLFYQKFVAQKWCTLCLSVQAIFIFLFILSICTITINGIYELLNTKSVIDIIMIFLVICSIYQVKTISFQRNVAKVREEFMSSMVHELKFPLSIIKKKLLALKQEGVDNLNERQLEALNGGFDRVLHLNNFVFKLLNAWKQGFKVTWEKLSLQDSIDELVRQFNSVFEKRNVSIKVDYQLSRNVIEADPIHFPNAISNLIENAIKYSGGSPKVEISCKDEGNMLIISVKDHGFGIPEKLREKIFERYFRVARGRSADVHGFGIGLSYVKQVIEAHGGVIRVDSTEGVGTTFTVMVPLVTDEND